MGGTRMTPDMKLKCQCDHRGNCLFQGEPLILTYPEGDLIFRALTEEEQEALPEEISEEEIGKGDYIGTDGEGDLVILARAIDPDRAADYGKTFQGRKCKADSAWWRMRNPEPFRG